MLRPCRARIVLLVCLAMLTTTVLPAWGAKWSFGCPKAKEKLKPIDRLGTRSAYWFYVHVGHDIVLRHKEALFSTDPDGNTVELTFLPLGGGDPIPLPPFTATAVSASTLQFPAPDTRPILGRLVVGPMKIVVKRNGVTIVDSIRNPTVLPPMNDMRALTETNGAVEALATMGFKGGKFIFVPFTFEEYGEGTPLPGCETSELSPVALFAADFTLKKGPDEIIPSVSFKAIKKALLFFGDYNIAGINLYGQKLRSPVNAQRVPGGGVAVCALNDTYELVMALPVGENVRNPSSDVMPMIRDGSPLVLNFRNISADPDVNLHGITADSMKNPCPAPTP